MRVTVNPIIIFAAMLLLLFLMGPACTPGEDSEVEACEIDDSCDEPEDTDEWDPTDEQHQGDDSDPSDSTTDPVDTPTGGNCSTAADCSYNGSCDSGSCRCYTPWGGSFCQTLSMGTVDKSIYGYRDGFPFTTSWGASAQFDSVSGKYLMLVLSLIQHLTLPTKDS